MNKLTEVKTLTKYKDAPDNKIFYCIKLKNDDFLFRREPQSGRKAILIWDELLEVGSFLCCQRILRENVDSIVFMNKDKILALASSDYDFCEVKSLGSSPKLLMIAKVDKIRYNHHKKYFK